MVNLKRVELEILKPSEKLPLVKLVKEVASLKGIEWVEGESREVDRETEEVVLNVKGNIVFKRLEKTIEQLGASIHSVELAEASSQ